MLSRFLLTMFVLFPLCTPDCFGDDELGAAAPTFDLVIRGGRIVDGTGAPWYIADVGIANGVITKIGRIAAAEGARSLDAKGLIVAPGFIDMMGQTATPMLDDPSTAMNLLTQGITTINAGEGQSAAPLSKSNASRRGWQTMAEYFQLLDMKGLPVNVVQTVGHTQVRRLVLGDVDRRPTATELKKMQGLVEEAMQAGAIGVSTALIYPPAVYATTEEIAALAQVAGQYGGRYYTHMRNEGDRLLEAIDEALEIGRAGKTPVHIFHLKAAGRQNWGKMQLAIARIKAARAAGEQVTADIYPYINNGLGIAAFIHPRHFSEGREKLLGRLDDKQLRAQIKKEILETKGWETWFRHVGFDWSKVVIGQTTHKKYSKMNGQTIHDMATAHKEDPWDTFFELTKVGAFALPQSMTDANKILAMQQDFISFCTDVGPAGGSRIASHPRAFGSFPRLLSRYVRDLGAISLEQAVSQASVCAANDVTAFDRGRISLGLAADVIVFDYEQLTDRASFASPTALSVGMKYVVVNGSLVLEDGKYTGQRPGRVLRGPGYDRQTSSDKVASGTLPKELISFDTMLQSFIRKHRVAGAAIAVTNNGKLVGARGYGYADIATRRLATPESLFRIASISKPITAVAIMQLVEQKKLTLATKVFDVLKPQWPTKFDQRLKDITIEQLLQHRGGWDRGVSFDGMFKAVEFAKQLQVKAPANAQQVIQAMLSHPLDFAPGERYAYSNFGYCLLGRAIEELTQTKYELHVKKHVLAPLGITTMRLGRTHRKLQSPGEVTYYDPRVSVSVFEKDLGKPVPAAYGAWHFEAMDSHGAWIASASDLARFAMAFDDPEHCPILSAKSMRQMHVRPSGAAGYGKDGQPKEVYYTFGWSNRLLPSGKINHWHTGSLPGTATIIIRRHDGKNFVALFNGRMSPHVSHLGRAIDPVLHRAANAVTTWPEPSPR